MRRPSVRAIAAAVLLTGVAAAGSQQVFRSTVDAVIVDVSVTERNTPVDGLTVGEFRLSDNGVPQKILDVERSTLPLDVSLVVDLSGRGYLQPSLVAGAKELQKSLRAEDRVRVVTFTDVVQERGTLASASSVPPLAMPAGVLQADLPNGGTALYDAVALSIVAPPAERRQLVILFSAGRDTASFLDSRTVLDVARSSRTAVFVVVARFDLEPLEPPREGATRVETPVDPLAIPLRFFKDLADTTGGRVEELRPFQMVRNDSIGWGLRVRASVPLGPAFVRALDDFRSSYVLRYVPEGVASAGWHQIAVEVARKGVQVRARKGYMR